MQKEHEALNKNVTANVEIQIVDDGAVAFLRSPCVVVTLIISVICAAISKSCVTQKALKYLWITSADIILSLDSSCRVMCQNADFYGDFVNKLLHYNSCFLLLVKSNAGSKDGGGRSLKLRKHVREASSPRVRSNQGEGSMRAWAAS